MAFRRDRDDVVNGGSAFHDAGRGLLRMAGGWGNVSGPGIFMIRTITTGTLNAVTFGIVGGFVGNLIFGVASLPFLFASCFGFVFGAVGFYNDSVRRSLISLERYPRLLQLHLDENYPWHGFQNYTQQQLRRDFFQRSWILRGMLVCSWLTAQPALDQINEQREQQVVEDRVQPPTSTSESDFAHKEAISKQHP
ncbi:hypothetical protein M409DRAFT_26279 [Zasmidium cellare ATCC 36951]|uniref:Uncharacterized protein n=1 Tax=Zasmidium cellare ATCC 36951 TaxID=1080233 RepID=A0A6A6C868_ZASCE|nr:uncharacterized protein M409DRAFT_26279 [Zasmidium cellare ATCC 36951]KAF2163235.1 hypothetical protein M409DRAFT_26279 [Zasmidium cellare ATCC 36951]